MLKFSRSIARAYSSLARPYKPIPSSTHSTAIAPADPPTISSQSFSSVTVPPEGDKQAHLLTRQPTRYSDNSRSKVLSSKDLTVSQLRQMVGYGVKTRGKKKWSGVVEGKSEVQCRQAWHESLSCGLRKALHNRPKKAM